MKKHRGRGLFAISSLGLGHVTRSLAIINAYLDDGWSLTIVSSAGALQMLRDELSSRPAVTFLDMADYPPLERGTGWRLYLYLALDLLQTWRLIRKEHRWLKTVEEEFDFIISDGRYGFHGEKTPSFILTHQVAFNPPPLLKFAFRLTKYVNLCALGKFDMILIPDFPSESRNLSGILSHSPLLERYAHHHVGILSSYRHLGLERDIDYLFVISGYLFEHKEAFVQTLLEQASTLPGRKVFILGQQDGAAVLPKVAHDIIVHPMVDGEMRQELFNRAGMIIGRAGYTTIMDLVEHDKPGLLIPTPNQTEQVYLAEHLRKGNFFATAMQDHAIDLAEAVLRGRQATRFAPPWRTGESVRRVRSSVARLLRTAFISIVLPAHNEEAELEATVLRMLAQDYPPDCYEIIVVENGSSDATLAVARRLAATAGDRKIKVLQSCKGVSRAKNLGIAQASPESEWIVFCDADTHLGPNFLRHLNTRLNRTAGSASAGTCRISPRAPHSRGEALWFRLYDWVHRLTRTSYSLQIARTAVARKVGFRADLELAEDLLFLKGCLAHGRFFFLPTDQVSTSTRRFNSMGYLRLSLFWMAGALLPMRLKLRMKYHAVR